MPFGLDDDSFDEADLSGLEDEPVDCYEHTVLVEVDPLDPNAGSITHDVVIRADRPLSQNELQQHVLAEVAPWLGVLASYRDFVTRFGQTPTYRVIGVGITRGC